MGDFGGETSLHKKGTGTWGQGLLEEELEGVGVEFHDVEGVFKKL